MVSPTVLGFPSSLGVALLEGDIGVVIIAIPIGADAVAIHITDVGAAI